jgi:HKD family nuclease
MSFRLVDRRWQHEFDRALKYAAPTLCFVSPFIKESVVERILQRQKATKIRIITRFCLSDFADGVSDIDALRQLLRVGASIRGIRNLHSKLYIFGDREVMLTSANLTQAALVRNHELGLVSLDGTFVKSCREYFETYWSKGKTELTEIDLDKWQAEVEKDWVSRPNAANRSSLPDYGTDAKLDVTLIPIPIVISEASQSFVKFSGTSKDRAALSYPIRSDLKDSGSHEVCAYPHNKRPRQVRDGAVMFLGRLVRDQDIRIYGRAIGMKHVPGRDDATDADIKLRGWRHTWSRYIRVHDGKFIDGNLGDGVSLNELMESLGSDAFESTQRNQRSGIGSVDPRKAYMQRASVELSSMGSAWVNERLEYAFLKHGTLAPAVLELIP